jgi:hypothetical protein
MAKYTACRICKISAACLAGFRMYQFRDEKGVYIQEYPYRVEVPDACELPLADDIMDKLRKQLLVYGEVTLRVKTRSNK